jgi:molecular chaperone DnaK (HSP70)
MMGPRFSIAIDLGTTNTALAFVPLEADGPSQMLAIAQLESLVAIVEAPTLPSFLYLPEDLATPDPRGEDATDERWVIGTFARAQAAQTPGRVVHSAKSWLAHHSADRSARFLPWGSDDVPREDKISPIGASTLILRYLREAWNERFAGEGDDFAFDAQLVTITVPASFDEVAQRLTLAAAQLAGYPETVRLLEEPQAALYRWLELHDPGTQSRHVLVVDIGGGTSDFSLFEFRADDDAAESRIERIAVSEHILLGGDNMDLALAHRLEPQLVDEGENLSGRQWEYLVARCRDLKETALGTHGSTDDVFSVAIPGRGSRLIAGAMSAQLTRAEIERLLLDGFFPVCSADEYPIRTKAALRELGLPYARDPAITRHLADFLRGRPVVDAVLFNGGSLHPERLRERIRAEVEKWQGGAAPIGLENTEPDLAVARGAARFGKLVHGRAQRIEAGNAHAIFLQAHRTTDADVNGGRSLVCVLPQGAPTEKTFAISDLALALRVNALVRFQTFSSARHGVARAGDIVAWNERDFQALPALETIVQVSGPIGVGGTSTSQTVPVTLTARVSELGRLEVSCVSADAAIRGTWPLDFDLRGQDTTDSADPRSRRTIATPGAGPNVAADALHAARTRITTLFERPINNRDRLTATRLLKSLETILGTPKSAWNVILVRSLWATLERCMPYRQQSIDQKRPG